MSWINFNDSLSNIKGQITSFANNVLAEENPDTDSSKEDVETLKQLCLEQKDEIGSLRRLNEELTLKNGSKIYENGNETEDANWSWSTGDTGQSKTDQTKTEETITNLKKRILELECDNKDLCNSLDQLDVNHQQNTEKLVAMKDKLQADNDDLQDRYENLNQKYNKLAKIENSYKGKLEELRNKYEELSARDDEKNGIDFKNKYERVLEQCQFLKEELEAVKNEYGVLQSTNEALQRLLDNQNSVVDQKIADMKAQMQQLEIENKAIKITLQSSKENMKEYEMKSIADSETSQKLSALLDGYEKRVTALTEELANTKIGTDEGDKQNEIEMLRTELEKTEAENIILSERQNEIHKKYLEIISERIKKYVDGDKVPDIHESLANEEQDGRMTQFSNQIENILRILADFKSKSESLEKEVFEITKEKTDMGYEKNHEIERLIQHSDLLSQEVITKTRMIKDFEEECSELMKNNELLITELSASKNTGLQTISESNEDNLADLENQLESANRKIDDLEKTLSDLDNSRDSLDSFSPIPELAGKKLEIQHEQLKNDYNDLLKSFDDSQIENNLLKSELADLRDNIYSLDNEKDNLRAAIEKLKTDSDTTEYQFEELKIALETKTEEVEELTSKLQQTKKQCQQQIEVLNNTLSTTVEKMDLQVQRVNQLESKVSTLCEELNTAKIYETTLKLQCDRLQNECATTLEAKHNLDEALKKSVLELRNSQNNLEQLNEEIYSHKTTSVELREALAKSDSKIEELAVRLGIKQEENLLIHTAQDTPRSEEFETVTLDVSDNETLENEFKGKYEAIAIEFEELTRILKKFETENVLLQVELERLGKVENERSELGKKCEILEVQLIEMNSSRNELINYLQTKHQESTGYHNEVQRLSLILKQETEKCLHLQEQLDNQTQEGGARQEMVTQHNEELEKLTDQNNFLKEKCEVLTKNLLEEQSKVQKMLSDKSQPSEKDIALGKKLERLQSHLIEVEEHYTEELLQSEQKNTLLQSKLNEIEQREKQSSTLYTSVSIRANQQVESLNQQLQLVTNQRDELRKKLSDAEDEDSKKGAALANLQFVLEQFQKEKEHDVLKETERIRKQIKKEQDVQNNLRKEMTNLKAQLDESKQGLQAALRLSDQLGLSKRQTSSLKEEVSQLAEKLRLTEEKLKASNSQTDGKVDKSLVKNLIIGFVSSNNNYNKDQSQILKIIATVLDFNQQDHDKVNLSLSQHGSWLTSLLAPEPGQNVSQESLSQAFVKFLETESKPRVMPSLLANSTPTTINPETSSRSSTPRQLNEIVLPSFADFAQNRNSSGILKDVLKDNS